MTVPNTLAYYGMTTITAIGNFVVQVPGVNFTDILQTAFSYEGFLRSFYVLTIWVRNFLAKGFWRKSCS
jgi:hypothetical protein